jgi:hypothetical protein
MSALSRSHVNASHRARRRSLFARAFEALCRARMAQAERVIREHRHLLSDTHGRPYGQRADVQSPVVIGD